MPARRADGGGRGGVREAGGGVSAQERNVTVGKREEHTHTEHGVGCSAAGAAGGGGGRRRAPERNHSLAGSADRPGLPLGASSRAPKAGHQATNTSLQQATTPPGCLACAAGRPSTPARPRRPRRRRTRG